MAGVFSKQRFGFTNETTIEQHKNCSETENHQEHSALDKCVANMMQWEKFP